MFCFQGFRKLDKISNLVYIHKNLRIEANILLCKKFQILMLTGLHLHLVPYL